MLPWAVGRQIRIPSTDVVSLLTRNVAAARWGSGRQRPAEYMSPLLESLGRPEHRLDRRADCSWQRAPDLDHLAALAGFQRMANRPIGPFHLVSAPTIERIVSSAGRRSELTRCNSHLLQIATVRQLQREHGRGLQYFYFAPISRLPKNLRPVI